MEDGQVESGGMEVDDTLVKLKAAQKSLKVRTALFMDAVQEFGLGEGEEAEWEFDGTVGPLLAKKRVAEQAVAELKDQLVSERPLPNQIRQVERDLADASSKAYNTEGRIREGEEELTQLRQRLEKREARQQSDKEALVRQQAKKDELQVELDRLRTDEIAVRGSQPAARVLPAAPAGTGGGMSKSRVVAVVAKAKEEALLGALGTGQSNYALGQTAAEAARQAGADDAVVDRLRAIMSAVSEFSYGGAGAGAPAQPPLLRAIPKAVGPAAAAAPPPPKAAQGQEGDDDSRSVASTASVAVPAKQPPSGTHRPGPYTG